MENIPIDHLKAFAKGLDLRQAILFAWDGERSHIVTWGDSAEVSSAAAEAANKIKKALGWGEGAIVESARVQELDQQLAQLGQELFEAKQSNKHLTLALDKASKEILKAQQPAWSSSIRLVYCIEMTEMEFGQRPDGFVCFLTEQDAKTYLDAVTRDRRGPAPDSYVRYDLIGWRPCSDSRHAKLVLDAKIGANTKIYVDKLSDLMSVLE